MQDSQKMNFNEVVVRGLYEQFAKEAFSESIRMLLNSRLLSPEEGMIVTKAIKHSKCHPSLLARSYIIYLCNGMLDSKEQVRINRLKTQLLLELGIRLLGLGLESAISLKMDRSSFSLELNHTIPEGFTSMEKKENEFNFIKEGKIIHSVSKNQRCAITEDIHFLEQDHNPYNISNDHPDQAFVAYDLGGKPRDEWVRQFRDAYKLILEKTPKIYEEIYRFLDAIVPHGYAPQKQFSSSYSRSPGILYLSYTDTDETQSEALIHEIHHTLFNIIDWKYPLLENDMSLQYYSAYRPDARHMRGCFLGLHAFVAVQHFYKILSLQDKNQMHLDHFLTFYLKNAKVIDIVEKYAKLTESGKLLFEDIKIRFANDSHFPEEIKRDNPHAFEEIREKVERHLRDAIANNAVLLH